MMVTDFLHFTDPFVALGHKNGLCLLDLVKGALNINWDIINTPFLNKCLDYRDPLAVAMWCAVERRIRMTYQDTSKWWCVVRMKIYLLICVRNGNQIVHFRKARIGGQVIIRSIFTNMTFIYVYVSKGAYIQSNRSMSMDVLIILNLLIVSWWIKNINIWWRFHNITWIIGTD